MGSPSLLEKVRFVEKSRTVSDTKRSFYSHHTRPITSVYRRVVEELMVEMHLLSVNADFRPDPIYYLGVVTSFDRFMQGYQPEADRESIFNALCQALEGNTAEYRASSQEALNLAKRLSSIDDLVNWLKSPTPSEGEHQLAEAVTGIAGNANFKYSRLFATGLYTLVEQINPEVLKEEPKRNEAFKPIAEALHLPEERLKKDLDIYRSNLEKISQILIVLQDALEADRKKREKRLEDKQKAATDNQGK